MKITEHTFKANNTLGKRQKTIELIIHCSATPEGKDYTVDQIDTWHKARKFSCIGYNFVIYRDGTVHRGRPEWATGAHCTGHNSISLGICYIGGVAADGKTPKDTRTPAQKQAMKELVTELMTKYKIPKNKIYGHRAFANKACPSFDVAEWRKDL